MITVQRSLITLGIFIFALLAYALKSILEPFLIAALFAYLGNPLVCRLQRWRLPRTLAVIIVFLLMILVLTLFLGLLIPLLQKQVFLLFAKIPTLITYIQTAGLPWLNQLLDNFGLSQYLQTESLKTLLHQHWQQISGYLSTFWHSLSQSSFAFLSFIIDLLLIPVVTFYLLRDWPILLTNIETLLPRRYAGNTVRLLSQCDDVLGAFFKGQLLVMLCLGLMYSLSLSLLGIQFGLLIGLMAGLLSIVPYLGFSIGLIAASIAALVQFHDYAHLIYVLIVFLVGNALEGMVLTPWLVGDKIGLHPVAVIFAILAGGQLAGFIGILVALPVAAVLMVFLRELHQHYLDGSWAK